MFKSILVVCVGNICRSPTAECLLSTALKDNGMHIESAGLGALVGHPMDEKAHNLLLKHGYDWSNHKAKQITRELIHQHDLVLVMEQGHLNAVCSMAPEARGKTFLLTKWLKNQDIADPYKKSETLFELVYKLIEEACDTWIKRLS